MATKLLIVEDSVTIFETVRAYLEHIYELDHALTGKEGIEKLKKSPSLVLLDLNLPDVHGLNLIQKIKELHIPIIVMTGEKSKETVIKALQGGISDYLTKPIDPLRLKKSIEKALK